MNSLPRDTEEGRAFLQSRLARYGELGAYLALGCLAVVTITGLLTGLPDVLPAGIAETASFLVAVAVSRIKYARPLSPRLLISIDYVFTWINTGFFVALGFALPTFSRPELVQLCCVTDLLAARAFLVPSTTRRTVLVGMGPILAIVVSTYLFYRNGRPHPDSPPLAAYVQVAAVLGLVPLAVTAFTSRTIFGLRERARQAMQLGQYTLLEKIGAGGMGVVYKARHATLRRPTAIKLLPPERAGAHNLARFEREVQLTCTLTHPNTIAIFDYGRSADGVLYYAMEYLDGLDLESLVTLTGPLPESRVVHVLSQVAAALGEAHAAGLMHRDIKPQNVLLCTRGGETDVAKVVDFGLVKELASTVDESLSSAGMIVGTPLYMSPEAIVRPSELDARGDLYALGAVGYYLLTGTPPFRGGSVVEICGQQLHAEPEQPSARLGRSVSPELTSLLLQCLQKQPAARVQSAHQLRLALRALPIAPWTSEHSDSWWAEHAEQITRYKHERMANEPTDSRPMATVAVDLRERNQDVVAWHSAPTANLEQLER